MIVFSAITPHPPIIIPGIGRPEDLRTVQKTISAMKKLAKDFEKEKPDAIIIISPHARMDYHGFVINSESGLRGSFIDFGLDEVLDFSNDLEIANKIAYLSDENGIVAHLHGSFLDHGALVPLYYLSKNIKPKLAHLAYSLENFETHYKYGQIVRKVIDEEKNKKIAVVASGDLSHRLKPGAPAGYSEKGKVFDEKLIKLLSENDVSGIINMDSGLINEAGECGLRSIIILLGILGGKYKFKLLNYEGPFGVGYLTAYLTP